MFTCIACTAFYQVTCSLVAMLYVPSYAATSFGLPLCSNVAYTYMRSTCIDIALAADREANPVHRIGRRGHNRACYLSQVPCPPHMHLVRCLIRNVTTLSWRDWNQKVWAALSASLRAACCTVHIDNPRHCSRSFETEWYLQIAVATQTKETAVMHRSAKFDGYRWCKKVHLAVGID